MEGLTSTIKNQILELRQLEEAAKLQFDDAKNKLLSIKKQRIELEKLLSPTKQ